MSEDNTTAEGQDNTAAERDAASKDTARTFTQDEVNRLLAKERRDQEARFAGYDELKAKAAKFDEAEEANKSELDKALARADKAEQALAAAEATRLRMQVAAAKGLPADLAARLQGGSAGSNPVGATTRTLPRRCGAFACGFESEHNRRVSFMTIRVSRAVR